MRLNSWKLSFHVGRHIRIARQEDLYHVIHRIASLPKAHGIFKAIMDWCFQHDTHIRIDTHRDNSIMRHCIESYGFQYCGIIHLASGDERLAYQLCRVDSYVFLYVSFLAVLLGFLHGIQ